MVSEKFTRKRNKLFEKLREADKLTEELEQEIEEIYGSRGARAIDVVKSDGVREEGGKWIVEGREEEYEVVKTHCSCYDYVLNIAPGKTDVDMCYHALAKNIHELLNK